MDFGSRRGPEWTVLILDVSPAHGTEEKLYSFSLVNQVTLVRSTTIVIECRPYISEPYTKVSVKSQTKLAIFKNKGRLLQVKCPPH